MSHAFSAASHKTGLAFCSPLLCVLTGCLLLFQSTIRLTHAEEDQREIAAEIEAVDGGLANEAPDAVKSRRAWIMPVPLPLRDRDVDTIRKKLQSILADAAAEPNKGMNRPVVVLQFVQTGTDFRNDKELQEKEPVGKGTEYERALTLARYLVGPEGVRLKTIAYLPQSLEGHAVLIALACEEIAMAPLAEMGRAGIDDALADDVVANAYRAMSERRRLLPEAAVQTFLDSSQLLYRVETINDAIEFVSEKDLGPMRADGVVRSETQISIPNQLNAFTGQDMRSWQWIQYVVTDADQLASLLKVDRLERVSQVGFSGVRIPALIEINGLVQAANVNRWIRVVDEAIRVDKANLLFIRFQSAGGSLENSLRFAQHLAALDPTAVETVFFVEKEARGDAAIIALSGSQLWMTNDAILGGPGDATISVQDLVTHSATWDWLQTQTGRSANEFYALVTPELPLFRYTRPSGEVVIANPDLIALRDDAARWQQGALVQFPEGMRGKELEKDGWIKGTITDVSALATKWDVQQLPPPKRGSGLQLWVENIANMPFLPWFLLVGAFSFLSKELAAPGLGLGGFLALVCFSLFFWLKFLDGTVEWLEVTLVVGGLLALGVELFVIPGFGIFGFGGFVMLTVGLILSSQTFIFPRNEYQWNVVAASTSQVALACASVVVVLYVMKDYMQELPFVKWLALKPPRTEPVVVEENGFAFLVGMHGKTTTRCAPIGRAIIDNRYWNVHSPSELLEANTPIKVVRIENTHIIVEIAHGNSEREL